MSKILLLDRDGIINIDKGHVYKIEDFEFQEGIFDLCRRFSKAGYLIAVVTNQAGIAKGLYTLSDLEKLNEFMTKEFEKEGIKISGIYYCPHHPNDNCLCRKPKPGLILKALEDLNGNAKESVLVGDKISDIEAGYNAGIDNLYFLKRQYEEKPVPFSYKRIDSLDEIN